LVLVFAPAVALLLPRFACQQKKSGVVLRLPPYFKDGRG
jgi:hypothetical protein